MLGELPFSDAYRPAEGIKDRLGQVLLDWSHVWSHYLAMEFQYQRKALVERLIAGGCIGAATTSFLHRHARAGTIRTSCPFVLSSSMDCFELDMKLHEPWLAMEWYSVQRPEAKLLRSRRFECAAYHANQSPTPCPISQSLGRFVGFALPMPKAPLVRRMQALCPGALELFRLWVVRHHAPDLLWLREAQDNQPRPNGLGRQLALLPVEIMLYLMDAVWIQMLLCPCWDPANVVPESSYFVAGLGDVFARCVPVP
jgi:hypothetical protein